METPSQPTISEQEIIINQIHRLEAMLHNNRSGYHSALAPFDERDQMTRPENNNGQKSRDRWDFEEDQMWHPH